MRRQARTVALAPEESTSTTWAAPTPDGTRQGLAGLAGFAGLAALGAAEVRAGVIRAAEALVEGLGLGLGLLVVVRGGVVVVVREVVAVVGVVVVDEDVGTGVVAGDVAAPWPPQPARRAAAARPVTDASCTAYRRLIGRRSAGSPGSSTARPSSTPGG